MMERRPTKYQVPLTSALLPAVLMLLFGLVLRYGPAIAIAVTVGLFSLRRESLELTEREAVIRAGETKRVPWEEVTGVGRMRPDPLESWPARPW